MNEDTDQTEQQGYGSDQDPSQAQMGPTPAIQPNAQPMGGNDSSSGTGTTMSAGSSTGDPGTVETGQAAYGNSGQADASASAQQGQQGQRQSQNSPSLGNEDDIGQANTGAANTRSKDDGMPLATAGGGYGGSADTTPNQQDANKPNEATGQTNTDSTFAEQGQDTSAENTSGNGDTSGITDIETERSQGREMDIEGSAL